MPLQVFFLTAPRLASTLNLGGLGASRLVCAEQNLSLLPGCMANLYGEAEKSSRGRPRPKPVRAGGPLVFLALAPAPAKNSYGAHPILCCHPTLFGGWPQPEAILASVSKYFIILFCR